MKNTIVGIQRDVTVSTAAVQDDSYVGVMMARHPESGAVFIWPYSESVTGSRYPTSRIAVKRDYWVSSEPGDFTDGIRDIRPNATAYLHAETVADIPTTSLETGEFTVGFGKVGFSRAVARWIRDNEAPFAIEYKNYLGQWELAETVHGLDNAKERMDIVRLDYGTSEYRLNRKRR